MAARGGSTTRPDSAPRSRTWRSGRTVRNENFSRRTGNCCGNGRRGSRNGSRHAVDEGRRAASEATGRCRSAPEARGFAPVCTRRRGTASLRCARARHDTSRVITRRVSSAPACNRRRRTATPLRDEPRAKRPADVDRRRKHEASRRCALGAGGLRPFAALGLVMTRRSLSRVARHDTSLVIPSRSS